MRILKDLPYEIWYNPQNYTIYIYPPIKVRHLEEIKTMLKYYSLKIENIVIGRYNEAYL